MSDELCDPDDGHIFGLAGKCLFCPVCRDAYGEYLPNS